MAKPAFIYAFDNLGPYRFTELCGELFGSRYNGFMLGGEGADGGIDAEIDKILGIWQPETKEALLNEIIQPGEIVVFQFKHKVAARIGQAQTRRQLLTLYRCNRSNSKVCELHSKLVQEKKPTSYILVTNVEVNSQFRDTFINQCKSEEPNINHYQVIGLDELVSWIEMTPELRQLYFPTIFGSPRFDLRLKIEYARPTKVDPRFDKHDPRFVLSDVLCISVLNIGLVNSYISSIRFQMLVDGELQLHAFRPEDLGGGDAGYISSYMSDPLEPGRKQLYFFGFRKIGELMKRLGSNVFPVEVQVHDEIGNVYREIIDEDKREAILKCMYQK